MIDFAKFNITDEIQMNNVWNSPFLQYHSEHKYLDKTTGELKPIIKKTDKNLVFTKFTDRIEVYGSLHKYWNDGLHNANDFTIMDCISTVHGLCCKYYLTPDLCLLNNLEFAVNMAAPTEVQNLLQCLRFHGRNQFQMDTKTKQYCQSGTDYLMVKCYNKHFDYPQFCEPNTMRFEIKTRKRAYLNSKGIYNLSDLLKLDTYIRLGNVLLAEWDNILIFDKRTAKGKKYCNTDYWIDVINSKHRNTFANKKKQYYKLLGAKGIQNLIRKGIEDKLTLLDNCADLPSLEVSQQSTNPVKPCDAIVQFHTIVKCESAQRQCKVTGLDISMQRDSSEYMCFTGLRYYRNNHPTIYGRLYKKYLKKKGKESVLSEEIYYLAHNIRNVFFNRIHNRKRFEQRNYPQGQLQFNF